MALYTYWTVPASKGKVLTLSMFFGPGFGTFLTPLLECCSLIETSFETVCRKIQCVPENPFD